MRKAIVCTLFSLFFLACDKVEQGAEAPDTPTVQAGKKEEGGWIELTTPVPEKNTGSEQGAASMQEQFGHKLEHLVKIGEDSPYYSNLEENLGIGISMNPVLSESVTAARTKSELLFALRSTSRPSATKRRAKRETAA